MTTDGFLNLEILGNPLNWLIVVSVLIFVFYGGFIIFNAALGNPPAFFRS